MADNEKKIAAAADSTPAKTAKKKDEKPSVFKRLGAWLKTVRAECKKVTWASWPSVRQNTIVVLVVTLVFAVFLGVLDLIFGKSIDGINKLADLIF